MSKLLETAFAKIREMDESEQDIWAGTILAELDSERRWDELFLASQDLLDKLADEALNDEHEGRTAPLTEEDFAFDQE